MSQREIKINVFQILVSDDVCDRY